VLAVPVVVTVDDEDLHRSHFVARSTDSSSRPFERYLQGFENIRRVQKYIKSQALSHNVPVITNYSLDQALTAVIDLVVERATETLRNGARRKQTTKRASELEASKR
jgi:2-phosphoglycerate kinase